MKNIGTYNIKSYNKIMREIGKGGFEGIKSLIEQNLYLEYGYIQDYIPEEYDLKYQNLNDNGKIIILNNIIGELGYHQQIIGTRGDFEDFDWQKSLSTELLDIYNNSADDIEQKINEWSAHILINEIQPFSYSLANNDLMIDCYSLFRNLIDDLEIDSVSKNKVLIDIIKKLQESIAYNSNFLDTNSATRDDIYLLTEKIILLYQQVLTMIKSEFSQYFNTSDFAVSAASPLPHSNHSLRKTVFGLNFEFIKLLYENLKGEKFIDESCTEEIFLQHFFVDTAPETQIILHGKNQSDIGLLIDSLLKFFKQEYQDKTFFNTFWAERFKFQTNRDSQNPKNKSSKDISKIISSVKKGDRRPTKRNIIAKIVENLEAVPR
ncbi:hypothetical protein BAS10_14305 [Elizabethkingia meningoseptica]|uniref:hypothetical protein n=1 Tax=Elizabethkingia meningoseptica TaxID=238 RepID=UPI00099903F1|nr:hypothetical protein [Elizabethkingia meningoseptica]OPC04254.1 hypothetical protein BAS10_14305 [Elizabethkingia meningoseptica]